MGERSGGDDRHLLRGPFRAEDIKPGSHYELSEGHPVLVMPTGGQGAVSQTNGLSVLRSDPAAAEVGVDAGYSLAPDSLRAPDIAVGNVPSKPGWITGAPPLAVEYADVGQNEPELKLKISEMLRAGTRFIWVVRLTGPRRVEVYERDRPVRTALPGSYLEAPGILKNRVLVESLYDGAASLEATLQNLVQRKGFESFEKALEQSEAKGVRDALVALLRARQWAITPEEDSRLRACHGNRFVRPRRSALRHFARGGDTTSA